MEEVTLEQSIELRVEFGQSGIGGTRMEGRDILHQEKKVYDEQHLHLGVQSSVCVGWGSSVGEKGCMCRVTKDLALFQFTGWVKEKTFYIINDII